MRKFSGYTVDLMLDEYALRFNALMEQSVILDALEWRQQALAASIPYLEQKERNAAMEQNERNAYDIVEERMKLKALSEQDALENLREAFGG